ncbi:RNA polymerase sigma factor [Microtetraspora malaysiensis]|uniref:RNA polymerase sigma factor n=1 Tax=Microtetraspora malaysiensis TaxID=161358 RepID=UPI003D8EFA24
MNDPYKRFTDLYDRHYRAVFGYVVLRTEPGTAEDVSSETFLVAWRRLDDVPDPPLPWLLGVARNKLAKHRGVQHRRQALVDRIAALMTADDQTGRDVAERVLDRETALSALRSLREKDLEALALTTWHGLTPDQAAAVMGCSTRTYNVRLHRARARLSKAMRTMSPDRTVARNQLLEEM